MSNDDASLRITHQGSIWSVLKKEWFLRNRWPGHFELERTLNLKIFGLGGNWAVHLVRASSRPPSLQGDNIGYMKSLCFLTRLYLGKVYTLASWQNCWGLEFPAVPQREQHFSGILIPPSLGTQQMAQQQNQNRWQTCWFDAFKPLQNPRIKIRQNVHQEERGAAK